MFDELGASGQDGTARAAKTWIKVLSRYREPSVGRSVFELAVTLGPFVLLWGLAWWSLSVSYWGALALSLWASYRTKSAFKKYSQVRTLNGLTGAQAASRLLERAGITDVQIVRARGVLSDHYNPVNKTLALSEPVHDSDSVAAVGVACHEAGLIEWGA